MLTRVAPVAMAMSTAGPPDPVPMASTPATFRSLAARCATMSRTTVGAPVVERTARAETHQKLMVAWRRGGHDVVAGGDRELDRVEADAGGSAPHHDGLARRRGGRVGHAEAELAGAEEAGRGGGDPEREDGGVLEAHRIRDRRREIGAHDDARLEPALRRVSPPLLHADRVRDDPVADGEARDAGADLLDLARDVLAEHRGVRQPAVHEVAHVLLHGVERVDRDGADADRDLAVPRSGPWCGPHGEVGGGRGEPGGGFGGHGGSPI